jgi:hypothetical protein
MISTYPVCREYLFPATASQPENKIQYKIQYKYNTHRHTVGKIGGGRKKFARLFAFCPTYSKHVSKILVAVKNFSKPHIFL